MLRSIVHQLLLVLLTLCHAQTDVAQIIRSCGMFKLYKNRYLSGVKKFETVTVSEKPQTWI